MQDRYAGDIGDYGKFALLRALESTGLRIGVNWYAVETQAQEKQEDGKYCIPKAFSGCDAELYRALDGIFNTGLKRSIAALERASLLDDNTVYESRCVPQAPSERETWLQETVRDFDGCDVLFLDPDNGLEVKSVRYGSAKSVKYVYCREIAQYLQAGYSVVFYNHRQRKKEPLYFAEMFEKLSAVGVHPSHAITFPKCSVRDYILIPATKSHLEKMGQAVDALLSGPFGKDGLCRKAITDGQRSNEVTVRL